MYFLLTDGNTSLKEAIKLFSMTGTAVLGSCILNISNVCSRSVIRTQLYNNFLSS